MSKPREAHDYEEVRALLARYRQLREKNEKNATVQSPQQAADLLSLDLSVLDQEELHVIILSTRNRVIKIEQVYKGSLNTSLIRMADVFRPAIMANGAAVIVAHNHPSGDPSPSPEDIAVTKVMVEAGKLLDIEVLDHVIIGAAGFRSLKSAGLAFD